MQTQWFFEIPPALPAEGLARMVDSIPDDWGWVSGKLHAPKSLVDDGLVAAATCIRVDRHNSVEPLLAGIDPATGRSTDYLAILLSRRYPAMLQLDCAGQNGYLIPFATAKALVEGYLLLGYGKGYLHFYSDYSDSNGYSGSERVDILLDPGALSEDLTENARPPMARVAYFEKLGGRHENAATIIAAFREIGLSEVGPPAIVAA